MTKGNVDCGCYQLVLKLNKTLLLKIGKLGEINFRKGFYIYTGRSKKGLKARVERHKRKEKKRHWHIDYLLAVAVIRKIFYYRSRFDECIINMKTNKLIKDSAIVNGFGSSDCRCRGHLIFTKEMPIYDPEDIS